MSKNIYFAASIRGGRNNAFTFKKMIDLINQQHTVLTEQVGDIFLSTEEQCFNEDHKIYTTDINLLKQSDIVIAECTTASLGVGYELCYAEQLEKPTHIFYNIKKCDLSAMIKGDPYFNLHPYETQDELFKELDLLLKSL